MSTAESDALWVLYLDEVMIAYRLAKGARAAEIRAKRLPLFDGRGVHPFSWQMGRVETLGNLIPEVRDNWDLFGVVASDVRREADAEALAEFVAEVSGP